MTSDDITRLYSFNEWANQRLITALGPLTPEQTTRDLGGSHHTVRDVLSHIIMAEWIWLERSIGASPSTLPEWLQAGIPVLTSRLAEVEARRRRFLSALSDSAFSSSITFRFFSGVEATHTLRDALFHVLNHSAYHRGQLASMLRQLGVAPPPTDYFVFAAEERDAK